jgi:hypothetical protein
LTHAAGKLDGKLSGKLSGKLDGNLRRARGNASQE